MVSPLSAQNLYYKKMKKLVNQYGQLCVVASFTFTLLFSVFFSAKSSAQISAEAKNITPTINYILAEEAPLPSKIFWANFSTGIKAVNLFSLEAETISSDTGTSAVAVNPESSTLYFEHNLSTAKAISSFDMATGTQQNIINNVGTVGGMAVNSSTGHIYWSKYNAGQIWRADEDGSNPVKIVDTASSPAGLTIDSDNQKIILLPTTLQHYIKSI